MPKSKKRKNRSSGPHRSLEELMLARSGKTILEKLAQDHPASSFVVNLVLSDSYDQRVSTVLRRTESGVVALDSTFPEVFSGLLASGKTFAIIVQGLTGETKSVYGWLVDAGQVTALTASEVRTAVEEDKLYASPSNEYRDAFRLL